MALQSLFIRVTNLTTAVLYLNDINQGFEGQGTAQRERRAGPSYVPASDSIELALSSDVLLSYESGAIRKQVDAGNLSVSLVGGTTQVLTWKYDYSVDGGTIGTKILKDINASAKNINNAIVLRGWVEVLTAVTSAGAPTVSVGTTADVDGFRTATLKGSLTIGAILPFDGALVHNGSVTGIADVAHTRITAATNIVAAVAVAALTAGKFNVHLEIIPVFS